MSTSPLRVFPSWDSPGSRPVGIAVSQLQRGSVMVWRRHTHPTPKHHCHLDTFLYPENAKSFLLFVSFLFLTADLGLGIRSEREDADTVRALPLTLTDWDPVLILVTAEGTQEGMALSSCLAPTHLYLEISFPAWRWGPSWTSWNYERGSWREVGSRCPAFGWAKKDTWAQSRTATCFP